MSPTDTLDRRLEPRLVWTFAGALLALHAGLAWGSRELALLTAQDDGRYMILARALGDLSYRDLHLVGTPAHAVYPPLYPAVLAVWGEIAGSRFGALLVSSIAFSVAALGFVFASVRRIWSPAGALILLACLAVNPFLVARAGSVRSESLYLLLSFAALWALARREPSRRLIVLAGACAILAALTRTVGVALIAAIAVAWLRRRRLRSTLAFGVASAATVGAWLLWTVLVPQYEGVHYFADAIPDSSSVVPGLVARVAQQVPSYAINGVQAVALPTLPGTPVDNLAGGMVAAVGVGLGLIALFRRWPVAAIYIVLYAIVLALWPYEHTRFLEPVIPLLVCAFLLGVWTLLRRAGRPWGVAGLTLVAGAVVAGGLIETRASIAVRRSCGPFSLSDPPACVQRDRASYLRALAFIDSTTAPDAVFLTAKPEALYLYTGRRSILLESTLGYRPEEYVERLADRGVDYVLLSSLHVNEPGALFEALEPGCTRLVAEASFPPRTYLFRLRDPTADGPDGGGAGGACAALAAYADSSRSRRFDLDAWYER
ncbi:MAG: ArnT family glycosyltransferase [Gemmatimonadota bacterium]